MLLRLFAILTLIFASSSHSAVILQYHHVSDDTPPSTSISPTQFKAHMQYLKDNNFNVVPLSKVVDAIKQQQPLGDKWVAITFDDAFTDIKTNGTPILKEFGYPYTLFVNPGSVNNAGHMDWDAIKELADEGVIIANHGMEHASVARIPAGLTKAQWLEQQSIELEQTEAIIKEKTGQSWQYFAYPYGEFTPEIQTWLSDHGYVGFSQQSGAAGIKSDLSALPRFPVSKPYDKLASLRDKLNSLPLAISLTEPHNQTIYTKGQLKSAIFNVEVEDFAQRQLNCYVSGLGRQKIQWLNDKQFKIEFSKDLPTGRVRCNCTAPSLTQGGRFYWYSKPWFVLNSDNSWYPL